MRKLAYALILFIPILMVDAARAQTIGEMCPMSVGAASSRCQLAGLTLEEPITIPVVVHVIASDGGQGNVLPSVIEDQVEVLNGAFNSDFFERFQFSLVGVGRVQNTDWHEMQYDEVNPHPTEVQAKRALSVDPEHVLNIYIANPNDDGDGAAYGWSVYPFSRVVGGHTIFFPEDHFMHGVVVDYNTLPGGGEPTFGWNEGDLASHEAGHYLGLYHTWFPGCGGDCVDDTNDHREQNNYCSGTETCGESPPISNLMNNTADSCRAHFTEGQFDRMDQAVAEYKPVLAQGLPAPLILDGMDGSETNPVVWTNETFEGEDIYLLSGGFVTVPSGANVVLKADAQGNRALRQRHAHR